MKQKYSIKNGEIIFDENKIVIIDSAKKEIRTKYCYLVFGPSTEFYQFLEDLRLTINLCYGVDYL